MHLHFTSIGLKQFFIRLIGFSCFNFNPDDFHCQSL